MHLNCAHKYANSKAARFNDMDLLIDVNIALDVCTGRAPHAAASAAALLRCREHGGRLWLYTGSVQTLEYNLLRELKRMQVASGVQTSSRQFLIRTHQLLKVFAADKNWLAALTEEGSVFDSPDPEDEQLIRALGRFEPGSIKLLTRDDDLRERYPQHTITPLQYLQIPLQAKAIDFIDLKAQQDPIRPVLEKNIHRVLYHNPPEVRQEQPGPARPSAKEIEYFLHAYNTNFTLSATRADSGEAQGFRTRMGYSLPS